MSRNVFIGESTRTCWRVDNMVVGAVAAKMLEIYDKSQEFQPTKIDLFTIVFVNPGRDCPCPICIQICDQIGGYSLDESRRFREALFAAEQHVKNLARFSKIS